MIKDSRRGIVVGDETGGGYNGHNGFARVLYRLPNTGLRLEYSAVKVSYYLQHPQLNRFGVVPDYPVSASLDDVINNKDPQLHFVLDKLIGDGEDIGTN
jgi:C-terminal processing protease CtpA/Prc